VCEAGVIAWIVTPLPWMTEPPLCTSALFVPSM
jgi:hypothetical protein